MWEIKSIWDKILGIILLGVGLFGVFLTICGLSMMTTKIEGDATALGFAAGFAIFVVPGVPLSCVLILFVRMFKFKIKYLILILILFSIGSVNLAKKIVLNYYDQDVQNKLRGK